MIGEAELARLRDQAAASPRKRSHLLLHQDHLDQVQRLLIWLEPGTYVRPHQHSEQWEALVLLRGLADLLTFDEKGRLASRAEFSPEAPVAQIPVGCWHGLFVRAPGTLVMEVKPGPYRSNEFAIWAPEEGSVESETALGRAGALAIGEPWSS